MSAQTKSKQEVIEATQEGNYAFHGALENNRYLGTMETFSVGIFKVVAKASKKGKKAEPAIFRLKGAVGHETWVDACASYICQQLNRFRPTPHFASAMARKFRDEYIADHKPTWV